MDVDLDVTDIQLQMQVQLSDHFAGSGTYRILLFAGIFVVLRYLEMRYCFFFIFWTTEITECPSLRFMSTSWRALLPEV